MSLSEPPATVAPAGSRVLEKAARKPGVALWFRYGAAEQPLFQPAIVTIARRLADRYQMHHYGMHSDLVPGPELTENFQIHHLPFRVRRKDTLDKFLKCAIWLAAIPFIGIACRLRGVKVIWMDETVPLSALLARIFFGRNVVITIHDSFVDIYLAPNRWLRPLGKLIKFIDMQTWKRLPMVVTRVEATARHLRGKGFTNRIVTAYDPCDLTVFHPVADRAAARARFGIEPGHVVLVHHGVLHPNKGNDRILQALPPVIARYPHFRFLLVGDGPDKARLQRITRELGLEQAVIFTGFLDSLADLNLALNAGDISVAMRVGQEADNFHVTSTLVHNCGCGLPLLATRLEGMKEIVRDGENGFLFDPHDLTEFQEKLGRLVEDPALRQRFGRAALETAREWLDINRVAATLADGLAALWPVKT